MKILCIGLLCCAVRYAVVMHTRKAVGTVQGLIGLFSLQVSTITTHMLSPNRCNRVLISRLITFHLEKKHRYGDKQKVYILDAWDWNGQSRLLAECTPNLCPNQLAVNSLVLISKVAIHYLVSCTFGVLVWCYGGIYIIKQHNNLLFLL